MLHPIKTGLIVYGLDRHPGGIGRYTEELALAFDHLGMTTSLLDAGGCTGDGQALILRGANRLPALLTLGQAEIGWLSRMHGLQLVHDPTGCMPLLLTAARRVVTVHDVFPYVCPETSTWLDWLIYHIWLPVAAPHMDAIITVSEASRHDILRYLPVKPERVIVVPEAAHTRYSPQRADTIQSVLRRYEIDSPYILYVGSLEARKNLPRLLEAYARLKLGLPGWKLVIVGARKWKAAPIFETVKRLHLEPDVYFTGFVEEKDLPALYSGADLFTFPSLYEGFGLPVLEAMACGTPVLTSNISSLPEVAGDAALLVEPTDIKDITNAMTQVLTRPELAAALRERGLKQASRYSWERTARETLAVYEQVFAGSGQ